MATFTVYLPDEVLGRLDVARGERARSRVVTEAVEVWLAGGVVGSAPAVEAVSVSQVHRPVVLGKVFTPGRPKGG